MKGVLTIAAFIFISLPLAAQFNFTVEHSILKSLHNSDDKEYEFSNKIDTKDSIVLSWWVVGVDMPVGWTYRMADNFQCYQNPTPFNRNKCLFIDSTFPCPFDVHISPNSIPGTGIIRVAIHDVADTTGVDTMTFVLGELNNSIATDVNSPQVSIYPNPARDKLFVKSESDIMLHARCTIIDQAGQEVITKGLEKDGASLDVSTLGKGLYILRIEKGNSILQKEFIIQ